SIRVWEATAQEGKLVHAVFAHEAPVSRLVYAADGKTLYSLGEDRVAKAWDAAKMVERHVYPKQPDAVLAFDVRADHKQLALGRYDGVLGLLDEATGKTQTEPLPVKPKPPELRRLLPSAGPRGQTIRIACEASGEANALVASAAGVKAERIRRDGG